jgi:hypothetical protein
MRSAAPGGAQRSRGGGATGLLLLPEDEDAGWFETAEEAAAAPVAARRRARPSSAAARRAAEAYAETRPAQGVPTAQRPRSAAAQRPRSAATQRPQSATAQRPQSALRAAAGVSRSRKEYRSDDGGDETVPDDDMPPARPAGLVGTLEQVVRGLVVEHRLVEAVALSLKLVETARSDGGDVRRCVALALRTTALMARQQEEAGDESDLKMALDYIDTALALLHPAGTPADGKASEQRGAAGATKGYESGGESKCDANSDADAGDSGGNGGSDGYSDRDAEARAWAGLRSDLETSIRACAASLQRRLGDASAAERAADAGLEAARRRVPPALGSSRWSLKGAGWARRAALEGEARCHLILCTIVSAAGNHVRALKHARIASTLLDGLMPSQTGALSRELCAIIRSAAVAYYNVGAELEHIKQSGELLFEGPGSQPVYSAVQAPQPIVPGFSQPQVKTLAQTPAPAEDEAWAQPILWYRKALSLVRRYPRVCTAEMESTFVQTAKSCAAKETAARQQATAAAAAAAAAATAATTAKKAGKVSRRAKKTRRREPGSQKAVAVICKLLEGREEEAARVFSGLDESAGLDAGLDMQQIEAGLTWLDVELWGMQGRRLAAAIANEPHGLIEARTLVAALVARNTAAAPGHHQRADADDSDQGARPGRGAGAGAPGEVEREDDDGDEREADQAEEEDDEEETKDGPEAHSTTTRRTSSGAQQRSPEGSCGGPRRSASPPWRPASQSQGLGRSDSARESMIQRKQGAELGKETGPTPSRRRSSSGNNVNSSSDSDSQHHHRHLSNNNNSPKAAPQGARALSPKSSAMRFAWDELRDGHVCCSEAKLDSLDDFDLSQFTPLTQCTAAAQPGRARLTPLHLHKKGAQAARAAAQSATSAPPKAAAAAPRTQQRKLAHERSAATARARVMRAALANEPTPVSIAGWRTFQSEVVKNIGHVSADGKSFLWPPILRDGELKALLEAPRRAPPAAAPTTVQPVSPTPAAESTWSRQLKRLREQAQRFLS